VLLAALLRSQIPVADGELAITTDSFEFTPFNEHGGIGKADQPSSTGSQAGCLPRCSG
jgi:hypothetical protein